jgi:hypothetical protein
MNCRRVKIYHKPCGSSRTFRLALESHGKKVKKCGKMWKNPQGESAVVSLVTGVRSGDRALIRRSIQRQGGATTTSSIWAYTLRSELLGKGRDRDRSSSTLRIPSRFASRTGAAWAASSGYSRTPDLWYTLLVASSSLVKKRSSPVATGADSWPALLYLPGNLIR